MSKAHFPSGATLSITVFLTGAGILALEIVASRFMLPIFGTSLFVWGAVLSVTLISLAVGYRWGGRLADGHHQPYQRLVWHVLYAAGWIAALPIWGTLVLRFGTWTGGVAGPVVVSAALFAIPLTLLATVVPLGFGSAFREGTERPGRTLGDLFAISTAGSVVGALVTAYLAVPLLGLNRSLLVVAALLLTICIPSLRRGVGLNTALLLMIVLVASKLMPPSWRGAAALADGVYRLHRVDTRYAQIDVLEDERSGSRVLLVDGASQNWVGGLDWSESRFDYIPALLYHLGRYRPARGDALILGLGAGTLVRELHRRGYRIEAVELDPEVHRVAERYFALPPGIATVHHQDARAFVERAEADGRRFDVLIVDVAGGGHHPEHVYNVDAFARMRALLRPQGVMVANLVVFTHPPRDRAARHAAASVASVFPSVEAIDLHPEAASADDLSQLLVFGSLREPKAPFSPMGGERLLEVDRRLRPLSDAWNPLTLWSIAANARWHRNIRDWLGEVY